MRGGSSVLIRDFLADRFEYLLKAACARDDYADFNNAQIEQQPEVIQIPVIKWAFVVPFDFQTYAVFEAIDFVRRRISCLAVDNDFGRKLLLFPIARSKETINALGYDAFAATALQYLAAPKFKGSQYVDNIAPLRGVSGRENTGGVTPFMHLVTRRNVIRDKVERYHRGEDGVIRIRKTAAPNGPSCGRLDGLKSVMVQRCRRIDGFTHTGYEQP
jgi:hypothetical protein